MNGIFVHGYGAVSPAGWGAACLREALAREEPLPIKEVKRPGWPHALQGRPVPPPPTRPAFIAHARLRRTSPIAQYAVAAALEALESAGHSPKTDRLGIIFCSMTGCVNYSQRFYAESLKDPATASPLVFPETVFNAPASHLAALLGTNAISYTLVGDPGTYLQGVALAADWLNAGRVDGCLVVGAEEFDWLISEAFRLFGHARVVGDGAGALYLRRDNGHRPAINLETISESHLLFDAKSRQRAAAATRAELGKPKGRALLCDGTQGVAHLDRDELNAWHDWGGARLSPKRVAGEAFMAAAAWQCVLAVDALAQGTCDSADVSIVGCNEQAIAARFMCCSSKE